MERVREKNRERSKQYYKDNKEKVSKLGEEYRQRPEVKVRKKESDKQYYEKNKEKIDKYQKRYQKDNEEELKQYRKQYGQDNKERRRKFLNKKYSDDSYFAIKIKLRTRLYRTLRQYSKNGKVRTSNEYGIDYKAIIEHLKPFPKHRGLFHIDHIIPISSFDFNNPEEIKKAFAPENHQWLLAEDNLKKGSKIESQSILNII